MGIVKAATVQIENLDSGFTSQLKGNREEIDKFLNKVATKLHEEASTTADYIDKTGTLRKRTKKKKSKFEDGGFIVFAAAPHAHLVEWGHEMVTTKGVPTGKRVPPRSFMRNAEDKAAAYALTLLSGRK